MPPPSRTPTRPIRPDGEIPNSQDDDDERHSSDFEDLLEEPTEVRLTSESTSPPASSPLPAPAVHTAPSSVQEPTITNPLQLPSTAAHTLPLTTPPISNTSNNNPPTTQSSISTAPNTTTSPSNPLHTRLQTQITSLTSQISTLQSQLTASNALLPDPSLAPEIVRSHIKLLHSYNEIKDVGLGLMGLIADGRGVRLGDVMGEFGVGGGD
jgi:hypothetical protein